MEVVVHSTLNSVQGRVVVATDPNQSVDSLITAFCIEKGTQHRKQYVLRNKDLEVLQNAKRLSACNVQSGDILYLGLKETSNDLGCGCNQWWLLAVISVFIGCAGLAAITVLHLEQNKIIYKYGAVVDSGSTHSQIYVYKWMGGKLNGTAVPEQVYSEYIKPGIASYEKDPSAAGAMLEPIIRQAASNVPKDELPDTAIYLGATAGMRLLNASDKTTSDAIMNSTRTAIAKFGFKFTDPISQARILDGREEGAYSWVTANYLSGVFRELTEFSISRLFTGSTRSKGALDLGGASTQLTFEPENVAKPNTTDHQQLLLYGESYNVYTHSYLCYGQNEAFRQYLATLVKDHNFSSVIEDPCRYKGENHTFRYDEIFDVPCTMNKSSSSSNKNQTFFFIGSSSAENCTANVSTIFDFNTPCSDPPCAFNAVSQPPVYGEFLAFSGFYYTMAYLNLTSGKHSLADFERAISQVCAMNVSKLQDEPLTENDLASFATPCFKAVYIHTLLVKGYKFNTTNWETITFINKVGKNDLGWALGYMLNSSYIIPVNLPEQRISNLLFGLLVVLFGIFLAVAVGFACHARNSQKARAEYQKMNSYGSI